MVRLRAGFLPGYLQLAADYGLVAFLSNITRRALAKIDRSEMVEDDLASCDPALKQSLTDAGIHLLGYAEFSASITRQPLTTRHFSRLILTIDSSQSNQAIK
jgi:hypothetical protein